MTCVPGIVGDKYPAVAPTILQQNLERLLRENGMSMRRLSLHAGLNETAVKAILAGKSESPREQTVRALATALRCRIGDLTGEAEAADPAERELVEAFRSADPQGRDMMLRLGRSVRQQPGAQPELMPAEPLRPKGPEPPHPPLGGGVKENQFRRRCDDNVRELRAAE